MDRRKAQAGEVKYGVHNTENETIGISIAGRFFIRGDICAGRHEAACKVDPSDTGAAGLHCGFWKPDGGSALAAEADGKLVGAVWVRIMNDYGHFDDSTPSLAISLYRPYRGLGIGTGLMKAMLTHLKEIGFSRVSLSVQKANYAAGLYLRLGFQIVAEHAEEYLMVCEL